MYCTVLRKTMSNSHHADMLLSFRMCVTWAYDHAGERKESSGHGSYIAYEDLVGTGGVCRRGDSQGGEDSEAESEASHCKRGR